MRNHIHREMFGIGIIHGLASNDELLLLLTISLGVSSLGGLLLGVGVFSIGVVLGMVAFALLLNYPLIKLRSEKLRSLVTSASGILSVIYGLLLIFKLV